MFVILWKRENVWNVPYLKYNLQVNVKQTRACLTNLQIIKSNIVTIGRVTSQFCKQPLMADEID